MTQPAPTSPTISLRVVVLVIALSAPLALGIETLFRTQLLARIIGPELDEVREFFSPPLTRFAWIMVGVTVLAGIIGLLVLPLSVRSVDAQAQRGGDLDPLARSRRLRDRMLLLTSIPQVPAVLATLCFMAGSQLRPVLVAMAISTLFVLAQGLLGERLLQRPPGRGNTA